MDEEVEKLWQKTLKALGTQFGEELDVKGVLFLIGVQELGKGHKEIGRAHV